MASKSVKDQILDFLTNLLPGNKTPSPDTALVIFKPQRAHCDPRVAAIANSDTDSVCANIDKLAEKFRKACIPVYVVYQSEIPKNAANIDFHVFHPTAGDTLIHQKDADDVSGIAAKLTQDGRTNILMCGVSLMTDIFNFAADNQNSGKLNLTLLADLTANNNDDKGFSNIRQRFENKGVNISSASSELARRR